MIQCFKDCVARPLKFRHRNTYAETCTRNGYAISLVFRGIKSAFFRTVGKIEIKFFASLHMRARRILERGHRRWRS
jgi:hypothetical protein